VRSKQILLEETVNPKLVQVLQSRPITIPNVKSSLSVGGSIDYMKLLCHRIFLKTSPLALPKCGSFRLELKHITCWNTYLCCALSPLATCLWCC
jgi:hypothetical protein